METNEKKEFINDNIIYKKTLSISGIIYLAVAIAIFFGNTLIQGDNTSLKMAMMIAGSVFAIVGLVKLMAGKKKIIYKANGCPMKRCDLYFDNHEMHRLQQSLENKQFNVLPKLKPAEGNKAGIKLIYSFPKTKNMHRHKCYNSSRSIMNRFPLLSVSTMKM